MKLVLATFLLLLPCLYWKFMSWVIQGEPLNTAVQEKLKQGMEAWTAFESGCRSLGGQVVEDGPESFCRADPGAKP